MKPIIIKSSIWRHVLLLIGSLAFVAVGIIIILFSPDKHWVGWMSILFFGVGGIPIFTWQLLDRRPRLIINDEGIFDRTLRIGWIPWAEIEGAYKKSIASQDFICLKLKKPQKFLKNASDLQKALIAANQQLGCEPINLNLSGIHGQTDQILELILKKSAITYPNGPACSEHPLW
ncbi:STM3941 family protein [Pedosphaera parvula]|uniref:PH domain-containing protein n=1 Tax=Pedosphaera parvula (strain Ellin514) TaxID=320771 RepID=B9XKM2_PEDPL|nr:STM3941 family protein [Pedosphaera parvula]EEF59692.1 hypothetical protein Cflav_PD2681 [Pedosphaera parvula Ellin514]